ncbi:class I SAM-dependent methyltransferase [Candidatus Pacearchaeota archaeon]|nr:class I SAM-dependent methyltransferase [Candidatus Pacearchaeota archaeon]
MKEYRSKFSNEILTLTGDVCCDNVNVAVGRCPKTGLVQLVDFSHIPRGFYESDDYFPDDGGEERCKQGEWNRKRLDTILGHIYDADKKNVLDFGAGSGAFLEAAQDKFRSVAGYDLSKKACINNVDLGWPCYNQLEELPENINMITLFHVLEHTPEPWNFMAQLREQFPLVDTFVVEVPHIGEALISLYENEAYKRNHFSASHLYYFTNDTLKMVLERAGFEVQVNTQLQRYSLANHFGWLSRNKGGGQDFFSFFNDRNLNNEYDRILVEQGVADSVFIVCSPKHKKL